MTTLSLPDSAGGAVEIRAPAAGGKIIQRIRHPAGSKSSEAQCMTDADHDLVQQSRKGDATAFEALVRNHQQMIHALTFRMTGSPADAEDLAQEAFIRAYEQLDAFSGRAKFSTWLYGIAIHACLIWRRDEARRFQAHADCAEEMILQRGVGESFSDEKEMAKDAQAALMRLPAKQRAAIVLTIYDGLSHAEAAKILGCPETTVSWRVFAAKRKLKRWLSAGRPKTVGEARRAEDCAPQQVP
jgi:RNA polymerase sigma-70 factor (ECF subfamily)